ncbi:Aspartate/methionine/tyrosine aminotransferase [Dethiosulfatibacter aminovorans DSM 17477]|uniref:Aminotransferase n=1 Tax=Dethiosulfatibacter aminovorans DSM 17477 TaxID=1121476 RepID=A0A1M6KNG7_9FIRM|nr:aminotransferase class I/II-fold pyridoxal phosphate-dependent enzyme [Dethiosulfatibacter aminovorans]SHJ60485.1 Aspartate/methionine/tyrosine aminotransferase [Dethiosulfatibacter aminovorans DSM 17477]
MKNKYIARKHWNFKVPPLSKTNEMAKRHDDVIDLSIGDPDYPADRECIRLMYEDVVENGHTRYTEFLGDEDLRNKTREWYEEDYGFSFESDEIIITSGGTHAMYLVMESILDEGDEVIAIAPYYIYYKPQIELPKGKLVVYNTRSEDNFDVDVDELEKLITSRTKAIIINSPNNPSGKVYSEENIRGIIDLAEKHDFLVIADDIYAALNYTENVKPICAYEEKPERVVTIYSYSKDFSMPGLRLGHIIADRELVTCIRNVNESVNFTISSMSQRLGIYAIERRREIQKGLYEEYRKRIFYCYDRIKNIENMSCSNPEGTFYLFVNIKDTGLTSMEIWERILDDAHVLVLPGSGFGEAGEGFVRIACTVGIEKLGEAFDRLEKMDIFGKTEELLEKTI